MKKEIKFMIAKKNFNHQNGWSSDIKVLSNVLILNKANWYLTGCNESRSQLKAKPQPRRKLMKPGTEAYLVYVSPSIQRHGTLTRSVLLNTWPVNNYMKEQSVRDRATGRVDRESIASRTYMPSMIHARIRKNYIYISFLSCSLFIFSTHLFLCHVLSVIKTSRESIRKVSLKLCEKNTKIPSCLYMWT